MSEPAAVESSAEPVDPDRSKVTTRRRLPLTLHVAFWALIALAAAGVALIGFAMIGFNATRYVSQIHSIEAEEHHPRLPDSSVLGYLVGDLVVVGLLVAFGLLLAVLLRRGRNWARIVVTILLTLGEVAFIARHPSGPELIVGFFASGVALVAVWMLWLPASNRYFRAVGAARDTHRAERIAATEPVYPAAWAPDPTGRHQFRYWSGDRWTEFVGDYGAESVDPL